MPYKIILAPEAVEDLRALRAFDRATSRKAIKEHLSFDPTKTSKSRIKRLRKMRHPQYRLRVDEVRVFYDVTDEEVEVLAIVPQIRSGSMVGKVWRARRRAKQAKRGE
jgi:mRNA interferase RelE/StbE